MVTPSGLVVLTDRRLTDRPLVSVVRAAVRGGAEWVILRERDLPYEERAALAASLRELLPPGRLIVAGPDPLGGDAVHLAAADPLPADPRLGDPRLADPQLSHSLPPDPLVAHPVPTGGVRMIGRSCHAEPFLSTEDYVTLSPMWPTETKPGYGPALGPAEAARLAGDVPWLALGGIDRAERAAECAAAGAHGIAVLGAIMRAPDPERLATELTDAFATVRAEGSARQADAESGTRQGRTGRLAPRSRADAGSRTGLGTVGAS